MLPQRHPSRGRRLERRRSPPARRREGGRCVPLVRISRCSHGLHIDNLILAILILAILRHYGSNREKYRTGSEYQEV